VKQAATSRHLSHAIASSHRFYGATDKMMLVLF
jgi:hypothetical protein